jgi:cyclic beta-1,2-glucan synthetase
LDRSLTEGVHGLPLMGTGDWTDGMNRVGRLGNGESVWLGFFLYQILGQFAPLCTHRSDHKRAERYLSYREKLGVALNEGGWDGEWYRRAYYDNGALLGTKIGTECRIDGLAQAWSVISKAAPALGANQAMDSAAEHLIDEEHGIIKLLTPPFVNTPEDPGYIKGYVAGVRENGGQYTHAACWVVKAMAELGRNNEAASLLQRLSPVWHARDREAADLYKVEPYVIAADIYGEPPHVGRGGWTWYTGSAGWMFRVAVESVLGLSLEHDRWLVLKPCVPDSWPEYRVTYRHHHHTSYAIHFTNPQGHARKVISATLDDHELAITDGIVRIPLAEDGAVHLVSVRVG